MDVQRMYSTINYPTEHHLLQYNAPREYLDPRKEMMERANAERRAKQKQGKFKATVKHKPCYLDEFIKPIKSYPSPSKYASHASLGKRYNSATSLKKVDQNVKKKTYIDDIEHYETKHKPPGVGKYNLLEPPKEPKPTKIQFGQKISHMDNVNTLAAQVPGSGSHNPHKLKMNRTDYKFFQAKHQAEEKKLRRCLSSKLGPSTYNPIAYNTFSSIAANKSKPISRWSHGQIDKRKGIRSAMKSPSPAEYNLINQWSKSPTKKEADIGKLHLLDTYCKSARTLSVYN